jgi:serine/threonine protein kinase
MLKHIKTFATTLIHKLMNESIMLHYNHVSALDEQESQEPVIQEPQEQEQEPVIQAPQAQEQEPVIQEQEPVIQAQDRMFANPLTLANVLFKYETNETTVIEKWKATMRSVSGSETNIKATMAALIGMIQQLCFFTDPTRRFMRLYELHTDDIAKMIEKIRRRPHLMINTDHIDVHNPSTIFALFHKMRKIIGMFQIRNFMVRVEHAFDNSQICSEHYVVNRLIKCGYPVGIDGEHHIIVPVCVQLKSIENIPPDARTMFHHISYSIQPVLSHSQTIDAWYRRTRPNNTVIMQLCVQMATALVHLHTHNIVHGDIKPGNTLIETIDAVTDAGTDAGTDDDDDSCEPTNAPTNNFILYVIDYGMSGPHDEGEGTGGTKPFCAPETGNGCKKNPKHDESYHWVKNKKEHDMWSFGLMFFTMLALGKCLYHPKDYPNDFFDDEDGHVTASQFSKIQDAPTRSLFERTLCPVETRLTAHEFMHEVVKLSRW